MQQASMTLKYGHQMSDSSHAEPGLNSALLAPVRLPFRHEQSLPHDATDRAPQETRLGKCIHALPQNMVNSHRIGQQQSGFLL